MIRWLRAVIAQSWLVGGLVIAWTPYLILTLIAWSLLKEAPDRELQRMQLGSLGLGVVVYGVYRAVAFHPQSRPAYKEWLERTPWTPGRPLPDGPVLLAPQDLLVLALVGVPAYLVFGPAAWSLFPAFAVAYLALLAGSMIGTGPRVAVYLIGFGVVGLVGFAHVRPAVAGIAVVTYVVAALGFRHALRSFPWAPDERQTARRRVVESKQLGWPFDRLGPLVAPPVLRKWEGFVLGLLVGSAVFAVGFQLDRITPVHSGDRPTAVMVLVPAALVLAALSRLLVYVVGHLPPINLRGRLATGRLIIPRYDVVFVAPLLAVAIALEGPVLAVNLGMPVYAGTAIGAALATTILAVIGPDRTRWQLTAPARLVPVLKRPEKVKPPLPAGAVGR